MIQQLPLTYPSPLTTLQLEHLEKITKNLSALQLAWLSGYFWQLSETKQQSLNIKTTDTVVCNEVISPTVTIRLISASQTGNARRLAEQTRDDLINANLNVILTNAGDYKFKNLKQEKFLLIIASTHGSGEPPEEAIPLYSYLFSNKVPLLNNVKFAVFGLGDTSYENFAKIGKDFDRRLAELGGQRLCPRVDADVEYQIQAEDWRKQIITILKVNSINNTYIQHKTDTNVSNNKIPYLNTYSKDFPYSASLLVNQKITSRQSLKDVRHIEIDLSTSGLQYQPGDALGVWYENNLELINEILELICIQKNELVKIHGQTLSITEALQKYYVLTRNHPILIKKYATLVHDRMLLTLINDKIQLNQFAATTQIIDMIKQSPSKLTAEQLLSILYPLTPRFYSIASSQAEVDNEVHITVGIVRYKINNRVRTGGCSGYLAKKLSINDTIQIFIETNNNFKLPSDSNIPIIMICAGTGIAPFRAFMQQREHDQASGLNWLFFGNQHLKDDFLYQTEWHHYLKSKLLTKINVAWSRDSDHKIYIQDKIYEEGIEVWNWIQKGAYVYVCGNANLMANNVEITLKNIFIEIGNMNNEQAKNFLNELRIKRRYQRDIY